MGIREFDIGVRDVLFQIEKILVNTVGKNKNIDNSLAGDIGFYVGGAWYSANDFFNALRADLFTKSEEKKV